MERPRSRSYVILLVLHRVLILVLKLRGRGSLSNVDKCYVIKDCCKCCLYIPLQRIQLLSSDVR